MSKSDCRLKIGQVMEKKSKLKHLMYRYNYCHSSFSKSSMLSLYVPHYYQN